MRTAVILQLAVLSSALVIPDEKLLAQIEDLPVVSGSRHDAKPDVADDLGRHFALKSKLSAGVEAIVGSLSDKFREELETVSENTWLDFTEEMVSDASADAAASISETFFDITGWLETAQDTPRYEDILCCPHHHGHCHHGHHGHHGHPHLPPYYTNKTIYELVNGSKYSTKLAKLINKFPDMVAALNSTKGDNVTLFAPIDRAFERIPKHAPKPSDEQLKELLTYHLSNEFYPAGRVLVTRTIPTQLLSEELGTKALRQRLSTHIGWHGLTVNFYARIIAVDIIATNGVVHALDSILVPPPRIEQIIRLLPGEFSTLLLAIQVSGLGDELCKHPELGQSGGTLFAPTNGAFEDLGPHINAFLFNTKTGLKYLNALVRYHMAPNVTLYSDAVYSHGEAEERGLKEEDEEQVEGVPSGHYHINLPTLLEGHDLSIDIARWGRLIEMTVNAYQRVAITDGIAENGVIHIPSSIFIPPKKLANGRVQYDVEGELTVEKLKERLAPYIDGTEEEEWEL